MLTSSILDTFGTLSWSFKLVVSDESKIHLFLRSFFKYISGLKVQFNAKL